MQDTRHGLTIVALDIGKRQKPGLYTVTQQNSKYSVALQAYLVNHDKCRLQTGQDRIKAKGIANNLLLLNKMTYV